MSLSSCNDKVCLTDIRPLRHTPSVNFFAELGLVIVDVVELDGEVGLRLQLLPRPFVDHRGFEDVKGLLLAIQAAGGVQVAVILIDDKNGAGPLARQNVLDQAVAAVLVRLELQVDTHKGKCLIISEFHHHIDQQHCRVQRRSGFFLHV